MGSWLGIGERSRTRKGSLVNRDRGRRWTGVANCVEADVSTLRGRSRIAQGRCGLRGRFHHRAGVPTSPKSDVGYGLFSSSTARAASRRFA
jgi:hypothetical protein